MPTSRLVFFTLISVAAAPCATWAQDWVSPASEHPWTRFPQGAWKTVRVTIESFDADGSTNSQSEAVTRTRLVETTDTGYTLEVQTTVEVGRRQFSTETTHVNQSFGETVDSETRVGSEEVMIRGRAFPSQVHKVVVHRDRTRRVSTLHYRTDAAPRILRRSTVATDQDDQGQLRFTTDVEVTEFDQPTKVLGEIINTWTVRTTHRQGDLTASTTEIHSGEIPGGLVESRTDERDTHGNLVRRIRIELVGYGYGHRRPRLFGGRRNRTRGGDEFEE